MAIGQGGPLGLHAPPVIVAHMGLPRGAEHVPTQRQNVAAILAVAPAQLQNPATLEIALVRLIFSLLQQLLLLSCTDIVYINVHIVY